MTANENVATTPHVIVAGLGRCGTTLMMHMLKAGGIPCIGAPPSFEVDELNHRQVLEDFLNCHPGHALKLLDPHRTPFPRTPAVTIWMDRDPKQQSRSQAKMATMLMGLPQPSRTHMRRWNASLRAETARAISSLPFGPMLRLSFEALIAHPRTVAMEIAMHLCPWWPSLDVDAMARCVRPRSSDCAPDLAIEIALTEDAERRRA